MEMFGMDGNTHPYETVDGRIVYGKPPECQCEHCKHQRASAPRYGIFGEVTGYGPEPDRHY